MQGNYLFIKETVATKAVFALPNLGPRLEAIRENVRVGRGFQLIKCALAARLLLDSCSLWMQRCEPPGQVQ